MPEFASPRRRRRVHLLLVCGAVAGIALAVASMAKLRREQLGLSAGVVATINGVPIRAPDYMRAVNALASDRRSPLSEADRRHVLDRLIDEELLVQYGVDLGLVRSDRRVRGDLVSAVLGAQVASVDDYEPTAAELQRFHADNANFFSTPGRLRLAALWFRGEPTRSLDEARRRADAAVAALRTGEVVADVEQRYADRAVAPLPDGYLPPAKVREYVGPSVAERALRLQPGEVSEPIASGSGLYVLQLVDHEQRRAPALAEIEQQVRAEMKRRAGDDAVRATLDRLRRDGDVVAVEELP